MSEYQLAFIKVTDDQLRSVFKAFNRFMVLLFRLGLGSWGNGTKYGGYIMVIKHIGRKTGLTRLTPVNYASVDGDIYCTAAFGKSADWYLNIVANPQVEVWLPDGRWAGIAEDVTGDENGASHLRQVIIASGFAGPLFGVNPNKLSDQDFEELLENYRLIRIRRENALTGAGGPGDLSWIWPLMTFVLLWLLMKRRRK
jgi:deazaflavin-dependent oxidoreductase (nitroreductase family)